MGFGFHLDSIDFRRRVQKPLYRTLVSQGDEFRLSKWFSCLVEHWVCKLVSEVWVVYQTQAFDPKKTMTVQRLPTCQQPVDSVFFPKSVGISSSEPTCATKNTHKKHTPGQFKPANIQKNLTFLVYVGLENPPFPVCQWKWRFSLGIPHKKIQKILVVIWWSVNVRRGEQPKVYRF